MTYVWHSSWHYFGYISRKVVKQHFLESPLWSLKTRQHSYQQGYPLQNNGPIKIWKICVFLAAPFSKEICWYLEFFGHRLIIFKKLRYRGQLFWNYEPSKLLLHFTEYRLDQLNSNHTKIAVNSAIQYFEGCYQKKCLLKVWVFLVHPSQNGGPVKFLRN